MFCLQFWLQCFQSLMLVINPHMRIVHANTFTCANQCTGANCVWKACHIISIYIEHNGSITFAADSGFVKLTKPKHLLLPSSCLITLILWISPNGSKSLVKSSSVTSSTKFLTQTLVNFRGRSPSCSKRSFRDIHLPTYLEATMQF